MRLPNDRFVALVDAAGKGDEDALSLLASDEGYVQALCLYACGFDEEEMNACYEVAWPQED